MPKKSYALRNRRGYMDSTFDDGLRIVLQWMELRRQRWERQLLKWNKELYMMRRMWYPRYYAPLNEGGLLPGGHTVFTELRRDDEVEYMRSILTAPHFITLENNVNWPARLKYYAPGY